MVVDINKLHTKSNTTLQSSFTTFRLKDIHEYTINFYSAPSAFIPASNNFYEMTEYDIKHYVSIQMLAIKYSA